MIQTNYRPNKYIIWNYLDNVWSIGELDRGCWVDQGVFNNPIACDSSGFVYVTRQRALFNSPGMGTENLFVKLGPLEIGNGDKSSTSKSKFYLMKKTTTLPAITLSFTGTFYTIRVQIQIFGSFSLMLMAIPMLDFLLDKSK